LNLSIELIIKPQALNKTFCYKCNVTKGRPVARSLLTDVVVLTPSDEILRTTTSVSRLGRAGLGDLRDLPKKVLKSFKEVLKRKESLKS
jgi:hypothetical protein